MEVRCNGGRKDGMRRGIEGWGEVREGREALEREGTLYYE